MGLLSVTAGPSRDLFGSLPIPEGEWGTAAVHEERGELESAARAYARYLDRAGAGSDDALRQHARAFLDGHPPRPAGA